MEIKTPLLFLVLPLLFFSSFIWFQIFFGGPNKFAEAYFLDVGQGDSELIRLPHGMTMLVDGGPDFKVVSELDRLFKSNNFYIDLVFITHPQTDHFAGLIHVLSKYAVGGIIFNGRTSESKEWKVLMKLVEEKKIPLITVLAGDVIRFEDSVISILSPMSKFLTSGEPNDGSVVLKISTSKTSILLTGDITSKIERELVEKYSNNELGVDVLKIPHHGSKYSSTKDFLKAVQPKVAIIEVGGSNSYGHPNPETLGRITESGIAKIFRTDSNGMIKMFTEPSLVSFFTEKN